MSVGEKKNYNWPHIKLSNSGQGPGINAEMLNWEHILTGKIDWCVTEVEQNLKSERKLKGTVVVLDVGHATKWLPLKQCATFFRNTASSDTFPIPGIAVKSDLNKSEAQSECRKHNLLIISDISLQYEQLNSNKAKTKTWDVNWDDKAPLFRGCHLSGLCWNNN